MLDQRVYITAPKTSTIQSYNPFYVSSELQVSSRGILSRYSVQFLTFCARICHHHADGESEDEVNGLELRRFVKLHSAHRTFCSDSVNDRVSGAQDSEFE